jgi:serine/threonine protein kinase
MRSAGREAEARTTVQRFEHEAQATAALTSPHTIRLFDFGVADDGRLYYVMELLDGRDMASLVATFGPLPPARSTAPTSTPWGASRITCSPGNRCSRAAPRCRP